MRKWFAESMVAFGLRFAQLNLSKNIEDFVRSTVTYYAQGIFFRYTILDLMGVVCLNLENGSVSSKSLKRKCHKCHCIFLSYLSSRVTLYFLVHPSSPLQHRDCTLKFDS